MDASTIISAVAILIATASLVVSWWQTNRSNQTAEEANSIARESLAVARARLVEDQAVYIQPVRFDPGSSSVVFDVSAATAVLEVEFEFMSYASAGGKLPRRMVNPGEVKIAHGEFVHEEGSLQVPPAREFVATARWRRSSSEDWQTCGIYRASKDRYTFRRD